MSKSNFYWFSQLPKAIIPNGSVVKSTPLIFVGVLVVSAVREGADNGEMEEGEKHSSISFRDAATEDSVQRSREGQTHSAAPAATRGQCDVTMKCSCTM